MRAASFLHFLSSLQRVSSQKTSRKIAKTNGQVAQSAAQHQTNNDHPQLGAATDEQVINSCLAGETDAWSELYDRFQAPLVAIIGRLYGTAINDPNLVEEIAARVWYSLIKNDYALLRRFDVSRGTRFTTYISQIAKSQAKQYFRAERRRRLRESIVSKPLDSERSGYEEVSSVDFEEIFLANLTPTEKRFYHQFLAPKDGLDEKESVFSRENTWQLRHRILVKLQGFLQRPS